MAAPPHAQWLDQLHELATKTAQETVTLYRQQLVAEQIKKARSIVREYSSKDGGMGIITLTPRTNNTVRIHSLLAIVGAASGTITITLGDDQMVFPQNPPGGYIYFEGLDIFLGRGDKRQLQIATPGNPLFFGLWGEQVGDAQAIA